MRFGEIMTYLAQYKTFIEDKQRLPIPTEGEPLSTGGLTRIIQNRSYASIAQHRDLIQQEFDHLLTLFKKTTHPSERLKSQCYYYARLLQKYHLSRHEYTQAKNYQNKADAIKEGRQNGIPDDASTLAAWSYGIIGETNMGRIDYAFNRAALKKALELAKNLQSVANQIDIDSMISVIDAPTAVFNAASVGLFIARLSINVSQIIQHTCFPTDKESDPEFGALKRLGLEIYDKQYHLGNDIIWGVVNFVCNYNTLSGASDLLATQITAAFLVFDALWLGWKLSLIEQTYRIKKAQYEHEIASATDDAIKAQLREQLFELEKKWQQDKAEYWFNIAAAIVFTAGFSATLLLAAPAAITVCYFICVLSVAMYLSADKYGNWAQQRYIVDNATPQAKNQAEIELVAARNDFYSTFFKKTAMPLFITTCFAISWPITLTGVVIYLSYDYISAQKNAKASPNAAPADDSSSSDDEEHYDGTPHGTFR